MLPGYNGEFWNRGVSFSALLSRAVLSFRFEGRKVIQSMYKCMLIAPVKNHLKWLFPGLSKRSFVVSA